MATGHQVVVNFNNISTTRANGKQIICNNPDTEIMLTWQDSRQPQVEPCVDGNGYPAMKITFRNPKT